MYEYEITNRTYAYAVYLLSACVFVLALVFYNWALLIASCAILLVSVVYLHTGHIINNYLLKHSKIIEIYNGYKLGLDLTYVTKKVGKLHQGVSIALFEPNSKMENRSGQVAELLEAVKEPFEFSIELREINKKQLVEPLETKRGMKEIALGRLSGGSYSKLNKLKREIELLDSEIGHLTKSGKSFEMMIKMRTTVIADSEIEAGREAAKNLDSVASKFSVRLGIDYNLLKGERLLEAVEASL